MSKKHAPAAIALQLQSIKSVTLLILGLESQIQMHKSSTQVEYTSRVHKSSTPVKYASQVHKSASQVRNIDGKKL